MKWNSKSYCNPLTYQMEHYPNRYGLKLIEKDGLKSFVPFWIWEKYLQDKKFFTNPNTSKRVGFSIYHSCNFRNDGTVLGSLIRFVVPELGKPLSISRALLFYMGINIFTNLVTDHINSDYRDDRLENLRLIPNDLNIQRGKWVKRIGPYSAYLNEHIILSKYYEAKQSPIKVD